MAKKTHFGVAVDRRTKELRALTMHGGVCVARSRSVGRSPASTPVGGGGDRTARALDSAALNVALVALGGVLVDALTAGVFSAVAVVLRQHLFVWSVVSPKFVYIVGAASTALVKCAVALALLDALRRRAPPPLGIISKSH